MDNDETLAEIATYLTSSEANELKSSLSALNIQCVIKGIGVKGRAGSPEYYKIFVQQIDYPQASQTVKRYAAKIFIESKRCPQCKSLKFTRLEKRGLWNKIYYFGTTLVQCNKCKTQFTI